MELKEILMKEARERGICDDGFRTIMSGSAEDMVQHYLSIPDWCLERNFPTLPVLKKHFADLGDKGVFVGRTFHGEVLNDLQTYVFHKCTGTIKVGLNIERGIIPMLYLANGCKLHIVGTGDIRPKKAKERSVVPIYTFGSNDVSAWDNRYVKFTRYKSELI